MEVTRLYFREGKSDKVYVAVVNDLVVSCSWGRRGATLQKKDFTFPTRFQAENYYHLKLEEKRAKGYTLDASGTPFANGMTRLPMPPPVTQMAPRPAAPAPKPVQSIPAPASSRMLSQPSGRKFRFDD